MYKLSTDYARLFALLCQGQIAVGFVNYDIGGDKPARDVCKIVRHGSFDIFTSYGGYAVSNPISCPQCNIVDIEKYKHFYFCTNQSDADRIARCMEVIDGMKLGSQRQAENLHRLRNSVTFWQCKFHAVKHENNKLRLRNYKRAGIERCNSQGDSEASQ